MSEAPKITMPEPFAVHELWGQNVNVYTAAQLLAAYRAGMEAAAQIVPTNWCDELLTGKDGLGKPPWNCPDIERLLEGLRAAIRRAAEGAKE